MWQRFSLCLIDLTSTYSDLTKCTLQFQMAECSVNDIGEDFGVNFTHCVKALFTKESLVTTKMKRNRYNSTYLILYKKKVLDNMQPVHFAIAYVTQ